MVHLAGMDLLISIDSLNTFGFLELDGSLFLSGLLVLSDSLHQDGLLFRLDSLCSYGLLLPRDYNPLCAYGTETGKPSCSRHVAHISERKSLTVLRRAIASI